MGLILVILGCLVVGGVLFYKKKKGKEMPAGLEVFNGDGSININIGSSPLAVVDRVEIPLNEYSGTAKIKPSVRKYEDGERPYIVIQKPLGGYNFTILPPKVVIKGSTLDWWWPDLAKNVTPSASGVAAVGNVTIYVF